jgi:nitroreductase
MNAIDAIFNRKSVRNFIKDKEVSSEDLDTILRAGMAAPTAKNMQPWSFVLLTDREIMDKLGNALPYCKMIHQATAAIIVCAHPEWSIADKKIEYSIIDACAATENILIAAEALGLGAVWTAVYPREDRMHPTREIIGIPGDIIPLNVIPIGYPDGQDKAKDKYKPERIHRNKW